MFLTESRRDRKNTGKIMIIKAIYARKFFNN